ncbi:MAG: hypothetical protein HS117_00835 [Verrucomicrobiaceae bacterium]|jgi:hypothetical protein|nr:hypothetical protein [Verrucomicrobiaceae bacterium]
MEVLFFPFMLLMMLMIGAGIGAGLVAGALACGIAAVLVALGVVSSSALLGLLTRRPAVAVRFFLLQCGIWGGIPAGAVMAWLGHEVIQALIASTQAAGVAVPWQIPLMGGIGGGVGGVVLALMIDFILRRSHAWLIARQNLKSGV